MKRLRWSKEIRDMAKTGDQPALLEPHPMGYLCHYSEVNEALAEKDQEIAQLRGIIARRKANTEKLRD